MNRGLTRDRRGQTLQDYTIGIGIFLLAVTFVFATLTGFLAPFTSGVSAEEKAQADQLADAVVANYSEDAPNRLNATRLETMLNQSDETIASWYGLPETVNINVTVQTLNSSVFVERSSRPLGSENSVAGQSTASAARIVTIDEDLPGCDPACRLVVKVW